MRFILILCSLLLCNIIGFCQGVISPSYEIEARKNMLKLPFSENIAFCRELNEKIVAVESPERTAQELMKQMQEIQVGEKEKVFTALVSQIKNKKINLPNGEYGSTEQFVEAAFLWEEFNRRHCKDLLSGQKQTSWKKILKNEIVHYKNEQTKEESFGATFSQTKTSTHFKSFPWISILVTTLLMTLLVGILVFFVSKNKQK